MRVVQILLQIYWEDWQKQLLHSVYICWWYLGPTCIFLHNTKRVTSAKVQQAEQERKWHRKHPQETVISVREFWYHILKYPEVINNLDFVMIQTTSLETRTGESLWSSDNQTNNNFTKFDDNVTNNPQKIVRSSNEFRQLLSTNCHYLKVNMKRTKICIYTRLLCKIYLIRRFSLRPP